MHQHASPLVVVQPGTPQARIIQFEAQRPYQVECGPGVGSQADDIARVRRNFGRNQHDVKHESL